MTTTMTTMAPAGISFGPSHVPRNGDIVMYNIFNFTGGSLPEELKKLLNGEVHFNPDVDSENKIGNAGIEDTKHDQPPEDSIPAVVDEITREPENQDDAASSSHAGPGEEVITMDASSEETVIPALPSTAIRTEILKSIIYGGLTELIASLGVVTSAASTQTATGKVVALSLASLFTGLFVFGYKLAELWKNEKEAEVEEEAKVDQYEELLGDRKNYRLHCMVSTLSFLFFGLVPPLVYGFAYWKPEEKGMKIPTVTIVSIVGIALLAAMKAHIQRAKNCLEYFKIIGNHVVDGVGASVITTISGGMIEKSIEQSGWFGPDKIPTLFLPNMASGNRTWGSF